MILLRAECRGCGVDVFSSSFKELGSHYCPECGQPMQISLNQYFSVVPADELRRLKRLESSRMKVEV